MPSIKYIPFLVLLAICSCRNNKTGNKAAADRGRDPVQKTTAEKDTSDIKPPSGNYQNPDLVRLIFNKAAQIDTMKISDSIYLENEDFMEHMTDGGGSVTGYFAGDRLLKINQWVGLSYGIIEQDFYFDGEELIYVSEHEKNFHVDSNGTDHSRFSDTEFRGDYFFRRNKMVDMVTLGHNRFESDENDPEKEFLETAASLKKLILRKRKKK